MDAFIFFLIAGELVNLFDLLVIRMLWWPNTKRIRFSILPKKSIIKIIGIILMVFDEYSCIYCGSLISGVICEVVMNKHIEKAMELRDNPDVHYNCAQSILCAYADELGIDQDTAFNLGFNFGSGMKNGALVVL